MSVRCRRCLQYYDPSQPHNCTYIENFASFKDFLLVYECTNCGKHFTGMSNSGRHQCKYHPGNIGLDGKWTCCGGGRSYHTNPNVYNMVWTRMGQGPPPILNLHPGCTPCDHFHPDNPVKLPLDPTNPNYIHLLAHMEPRVNDRPGWDGQRLWSHPTYSTAAFQVEKEKEAAENALDLEEEEKDDEKEDEEADEGDQDDPLLADDSTEDEEDDLFGED